MSGCEVVLSTQGAQFGGLSMTAYSSGLGGPSLRVDFMIVELGSMVTLH